MSSVFKKVSPQDVEGYIPTGHDDTFNRRLLGPSSGSQYVEVILGEMGSNGTADPHTHDNFDQILYIMEGRLRIICEDIDEVLVPGDLGFIPIGVSHQVFSETPKSRFLVIYAPPREVVRC